MELLLEIESTGEFLTFLRRCKADTIDFYYTKGITHVVEVSTFWKQDLKVPSKCTDDFVAFTVPLDILKNLYTTGYLKFTRDCKQLRIANISNGNIICSTEIAFMDSYSNRYFDLLSMNPQASDVVSVPTVMTKFAGAMKSPINFDSGIISVVSQYGFAVIQSTEYPGSFAMPYTPLLANTPKLYQIPSQTGNIYGSVSNNFTTVLNEAHGYSNMEYLKMYQMQEDKLFECDINIANALLFLQKSSKAVFDFDFKTQTVCVTENAVNYQLPFTTANDVMYQQVNFEHIGITNMVFHTVFSVIKADQFHFEVFPYFIRITLPNDIKVVFV